MANPRSKPGRNDPCPCGSGNKYKKCCLAKDAAAELAALVDARARRDERAAAHRHEPAAAHRLPVDELMAEVATRLRMAEHEDAYEDELDAASNAVVQLVRAAKLDEAEAAARDLLVRFPDVHDGWDRLGMVHEVRGDNRQAADCYRKVIEFIRQHPETTTPPSSNSSPSSLKGSIRQRRPERPNRSRSTRATAMPPSATVIRLPGPRLQIP